MTGTLAGGRKAAATNREKYGDDFYARIGAKGGRNGSAGKGFAANRELARRVGAIGGRISKRGKKWHNTEKVIRNGREVTKINVKYIKSS